LYCVVLREQAGDGVLAPRALRDEHEPLPQQVARLAQLGAAHVGGRNQVGPEQLRERRRVDGVGFHLGVADRLGWTCYARA